MVDPRRTAEMVLGIIGGILGILVGLIIIGMAATVIFYSGDSSGSLSPILLFAMGIATIALGIIAIFGGATVKRNADRAGIFMLSSGLIGFITALTLWIVPGILLILGGVLALREPEVGITGKLGKMGVYGFRSGKKWKMVLAIFGYLLTIFIFQVIIVAIILINLGPYPLHPVSTTTIHLSDIEAKTNGELQANVTDVTGSGSVMISRLKWIITSEITDYSKFLVNGIPSNSNTTIKGGDKIIIRTGENWSRGLEIRLMVVDKESGYLYYDYVTIVKSV